MRHGYRMKQRNNASIRSMYKKAALLANQGTPTSLKVTMMGGGGAARGGWRLRWEKNRRKLQRYKQLKGTSSTRKLPMLEEPSS